MIARKLEAKIREYMSSGKAIVIYGPRQVGKTTLANQLLSEQSNIAYFNGDDTATRTLLSEVNVAKWQQVLGKREVLFIDEAQRIDNIGLKLKLVTDQLPHIHIIATGSSSFDLANMINEPLTGRKWEFQLTPLSFAELVDHFGWFEETQHLHTRLVLGSYPEVVTSPEYAQDRLRELTSSYLFRDVLNWATIKSSEKLEKLLTALALQVGSQVSYTELAQLCSMDHKTVERYIRIMEQSFIIFRIPSYSRNLRNELKFSRKIFFYDNGIRNGLLGDYTPLELRQDVGKLWENYLMSERKKLILNSNSHARGYFWRTRQKQEIDYIEEKDGQVTAFEFKWNPQGKVKNTKRFMETYKLDEVPVVTPENYSDFLLGEKYPA